GRSTGTTIRSTSRWSCARGQERSAGMWCGSATTARCRPRSAAARRRVSRWAGGPTSSSGASSPNHDVALDRADITVFRDFTFIAAGPASELGRSARRGGPMPISPCPCVFPLLLVVVPLLFLAKSRKAFRRAAAVSASVLAVLFLWVYVPGWVL